MTHEKGNAAHELAAGVKKGDRSALARALTLMESARTADRDLQATLLSAIYPLPEETLRIGISGLPGAGKSTLIDLLGALMCEKGRRVAVLAVDPSSPRSGGSILGDKTRMDQLSKQERAFIRPSPLGDAAGGVHARTRECIGVCEAAGYDAVIVETVGVGQADYEVRGMVDFFLLLTLSGGGDELQSLKRGAVELADTVIVNKADGDRVIPSEALKKQIEQAFSILGSNAKVFATSALGGGGCEELFQWLMTEAGERRRNGMLLENRRNQAEAAYHDTLRDELLSALSDHAAKLPEARENRQLARELKKAPLTLARQVLGKISITTGES